MLGYDLRYIALDRVSPPDKPEFTPVIWANSVQFLRWSLLLAKNTNSREYKFALCGYSENDKWEQWPVISFEQLHKLIISRLLLLSNLSYEQDVPVLLWKEYENAIAVFAEPER